MLRRTVLSRGHQMFKEPLTMQEHSSLARSKATHAHTISRLNQRTVMAATGVVAAGYSMFWLAPFPSQSISPDGKITQL
jgi:hypothetical protein